MIKHDKEDDGDDDDNDNNNNDDVVDYNKNKDNNNNNNNNNDDDDDDDDDNENKNNSNNNNNNNNTDDDNGVWFTSKHFFTCFLSLRNVFREEKSEENTLLLKTYLSNEKFFVRKVVLIMQDGKGSSSSPLPKLMHR